MSFESNLKAALNGKKLDDLQDIEVPEAESITVIPTPAMMREVIEALRNGVDYRTIQLTIKQNKRIVTKAQIKQIEQARQDKIAKLSTPVEPEPIPEP